MYGTARVTERARESARWERDRKSDRARGADTQRERSKGTRSENEYKYVLSVLRTSVKKKNVWKKEKQESRKKNTHTPTRKRETTRRRSIYKGHPAVEMGVWGMWGGHNMCCCTECAFGEDGRSGGR